MNLEPKTLVHQVRTCDLLEMKCMHQPCCLLGILFEGVKILFNPISLPLYFSKIESTRLLILRFEPMATAHIS